MADLVIREVAKDVWTFSRPFHFSKRAPFGGRSTAIRLAQNQIWVFASTPLDDPTKQKLNELGEVKFIIAGNVEHNMFVKDYKSAYPTATTIGPEDLNAKLTGWKLDKTFNTDVASNGTFGFENEIQYCFFSSMKNKDVAFFHPASKTALGADLLFNLPPHEQYSKSDIPPASWINSSFTPTSRISKFLQWTKITDKAAMREQVQRVAGWNFDRFIPCHGDVIEGNANQVWKDAFRSYL